MAHRHRKGKTGEASIDVGRRTTLARLGLGVSVAYAAPVLLTLSPAQAGVVVGDGDLNNGGTGGGGTGGSGTGGGGTSGASGPSGGGHKGHGKGHGKGKGPGRHMSLQELFDFLANLAKRKN